MAKDKNITEAIVDPENPWIDEAKAPTTAKLVAGDTAVDAKRNELPTIEFGGTYKFTTNVRLGKETYKPGATIRLETADAVRSLVQRVAVPADAETRALISDDEHREALIKFAATVLTSPHRTEEEAKPMAGSVEDFVAKLRAA